MWQSSRLLVIKLGRQLGWILQLLRDRVEILLEFVLKLTYRSRYSRSIFCGEGSDALSTRVYTQFSTLVDVMDMVKRTASLRRRMLR
ncbi:hypothetical protein LINPERHAP2_LOCUS2540 [Linum perenne]